jgi:hypothetical protein
LIPQEEVAVTLTACFLPKAEDSVCLNDVTSKEKKNAILHQ